MKDSLQERLANIDLALSSITSKLEGFIPAALSEEMDNMMANYFDAQNSWGAEPYSHYEFSVNPDSESGRELAACKCK